MGFKFIGRSATDLVAQVSHATERTVVKLADAGGDMLLDYTQRNTPRQTGRLRESERLRSETIGPLHRRICFTDVEYGPYVEHGTGLWGPSHSRYEITPHDPHGVLSWLARNQFGEQTGPRVFARRVMHPGSPGAHMFAIGAAMTEHSFPEKASEVLHQWKSEAES